MDRIEKREKRENQNCSNFGFLQRFWTEHEESREKKEINRQCVSEARKEEERRRERRRKGGKGKSRYFFFIFFFNRQFVCFFSENKQ